MIQTMKNIRRRMSNEKGASILIALFFLLICTVIAAIIVNAASVNSTQRDKDYQGSNQAYYTLSSAARLSKDAFSDPDSVLSTLSITFDASGNKVSQTPTTTSNRIAADILAAAEATYSSGKGRQVSAQPYTISGTNPVSGDSLEEVQVLYSMDGNCNLTAAVSYPSSSSVAYRNTLEAKISATQTTSAGGQVTITWK